VKVTVTGWSNKRLQHPEHKRGGEILLENLREKIETLQKEKAALLAEMKRLNEKAEVRAHELENEVATLRKEVKALEKLLDSRSDNGRM
jgi:predicted nuclease with TOPRIM domain